MPDNHEWWNPPPALGTGTSTTPTPVSTSTSENIRMPLRPERSPRKKEAGALVGIAVLGLLVVLHLWHPQTKRFPPVSSSVASSVVPPTVPLAVAPTVPFVTGLLSHIPSQIAPTCRYDSTSDRAEEGIDLSGVPGFVTAQRCEPGGGVDVVQYAQFDTQADAMSAFDQVSQAIYHPSTGTDNGACDPQQPPSECALEGANGESGTVLMTIFASSVYKVWINNQMPIVVVATDAQQAGAVDALNQFFANAGPE